MFLTYIFRLQLLRDDVTCDKFSAVLHPYCSEDIVHYDEHVLASTYKFGVVYQKTGQMREEELFGNESHSDAMQRFLQLIADKVKLKDFPG